MTKSIKELCREWLDTLVVAISVAMAFRAYFYEPFNIPTGSMQPTLYGNHAEPCPEPGAVQRSPLKWLEWLVSGRDYKEFIAPFSGAVCIRERNDGRFNLSVRTPGGAESAPAALPTDAQRMMDLGPAAAGRAIALLPASWARGRDAGAKSLWIIGADGTPEREVHVRAGQRLFAGYDTTGDFVFVNRWRWNFRRPARGEVAVFATTGIPRLAQGTHYIKRLTGLPGETIEIRDGKVYADGRELPPLKPALGKRGEPVPPPEPGANGGMHGPATMDGGEYFACGDNSANSFDSRYWGGVPERNLRGTAACVFWPVANARWGRIQ